MQILIKQDTNNQHNFQDRSNAKTNYLNNAVTCIVDDTPKLFLFDANSN